MTPPCAFLLAALLVVVASAQWPRLPKIDPGHMAGVVQTTEKAVKQTLLQKKSLRSQAPSFADNAAKSAAQAVSASAQTAEAAKAIAEDAQAQQQVLASEVAKMGETLRSQAPSVVDNMAQSTAQVASGAKQTAEAAKAIAGDAKAQQQQVPAIGGPPALATTPAPAPAPVVSEGSHDVHTDKLLETVQGQISRADKQQVEDLASKMIPGLNPSKVTGGVSKVVDGASTQVAAVKPMIDEVLKSDLKHVVHTADKGIQYVRKIDPNSARKYINGDDPEEGEQASDVDQAAEWVGSHWQWSLLFIVGVVGALFFGWQVTKRRDARSPTLLANSDMAGHLEL